ncbi:MAG: replication protein, partial [Clostridia bacterium]|nr:replication protein [Clostridia bacterium]
TLQKEFNGAHIEPAYGSNQQNRDYIRKEGKWLEDEKRGTSLIDSFEESGELPPDRDDTKKETAAILDMVRDGASDYEILAAYPNAMNKLEKIERARQVYQAERFADEFRELDVTYIHGKTGVGKTKSIIDKYGYKNVHRTTNYSHPFDTYKGQDVIIFEEFRSSLPISDMLNYLDGHPVLLPCRYADKQACFTKVFIVTNIPLEQQYPNVQIESPETWNAFTRRINKVICMMPPGSNILDWTSDSSYEEDMLC